MSPIGSHVVSLTRASIRPKRSPSLSRTARIPIHTLAIGRPRSTSLSEQPQGAPSEEPRYKSSGLFAPAATSRSPFWFRDSRPSNTPAAAQPPSPESFRLPYFDPCEEMSEVVLAPLIAGNAKWAADVRSKYPTFFVDAAKGQSPKVLWIGCADSRVPESTVLGCKPGEVFVHRNIANQFHPNDDSALAVLTYAVENLGVEHIVIAGHTQCGGAAACHAAAQNRPAQDLNGTASATTPLARWLNPLTELAASLAAESNDSHDTSAELATLVDHNVMKQVENVVDTDVVQRAWAAGKQVYVHGWVYVIETGTIKDLQVTVNPPAY